MAPWSMATFFFVVILVLPENVSLGLSSSFGPSPQYAASSISTHELKKQRASEPVCNDPNVDPTFKCWNTLNVSGHLQDWWIENQEKCNNPPYRGNGFASCYQQLVGKGRLLNLACNDISLSCEKPPDFNQYTPAEYYVLQSIFGIWWWFNCISTSQRMVPC